MCPVYMPAVRIQWTAPSLRRVWRERRHMTGSGLFLAIAITLIIAFGSR